MALTPLGVMLRPPIPGQTKTRLAATIGDKEAAQLYKAFVGDTLDSIARTSVFGVTLWSAGEPDENVRAWGKKIGAKVLTQPLQDLGTRIAAALAHGVDRCGRGLVIGTDAPTLPSEVLIQAAQNLDDHELVLGPTGDGGYYAIGAKAQLPVLQGIRWSSTHALEDTLKANASSKIGLLTPWYDIDTPEDLRLLRAHLSVDPRLSPHTRARLF